MAKKLGNDYRFWIKPSGSADYIQVLGQNSTKISRQAQSIDTSSKDDFPYGTQAPGLKTLTMDVELYPNLPDTGFAAVETTAKGTDPVMVQVRKDGAAGAADDAVFEASMYIGNFDTDFPKNGVVTSTFQLTLAAAPTIDKLA